LSACQKALIRALTRSIAPAWSLVRHQELDRDGQAHGGAGLSRVLEITDAIDRLHLGDSADLTKVPVSFVPVSGIGDAGISIKRVIY
jgi:tyrosinase